MSDDYDYDFGNEFDLAEEYDGKPSRGGGSKKVVQPTQVGRQRVGGSAWVGKPSVKRSVKICPKSCAKKCCVR
jgi:hypothetical protein